jgi:glycosyltransferase involved in cell wall biosynthesis
MKCKVSIIVPVYNAVQYIEEMWDSLYSQTLKEIEFIFIDDCSKDNSLEILYKLEKKDPDRVMIIKLDQNQGPGGARNIGISYASGEYIAFADSDDLVNKEMYQLLYSKAIEGNYDIVECGYFSERRNKEMMIWNQDMEGEVNLEKRVRMIMSCGFLWSKLYKRELLLNSGIDFITKIAYEDVDFLTRLYCRVNSIGIVNKSLYYYRDNENSFSNKKNKQGYFDIVNMFSKAYLNNIKREELYNILKPVIDYVVLDVWYDLFKAYVNNKSKIDIKGLIVFNNQIKQYISDYDENMFFVEKAKYDLVKKAFLLNASNPRASMELINSI